MSIGDRYKRVSQELESCCLECGRDPREVRLVAVSKTVGLEGVREALNAGACDFGENRPDQIMGKFAEYPEATWHFIGNVQSRRIPDIVRCSTLIHSVYQLRHVEKIDSCAERFGKIQDVLIEVNVSGEQSKSGLASSEVRSFVEKCRPFEHVRILGLMTMAPRGDSAGIESSFKGLANLRDEIRSSLDEQRAPWFNELSMGMSEDWKEGIRAGATIVRIGRAIFSDSFE